MGTKQDVVDLIAQGEGLTVEFKTARFRFPENVFETVCAFLNSCGGSLLLGVKDSGEIVGVEPEYRTAVCQQCVEQANNPNCLDPPVQLRIEEHDIDGRLVLMIHVPESQVVHRHAGKILYRNESGDFDISRNR